MNFPEKYSNLKGIYLYYYCIPIDVESITREITVGISTSKITTKLTTNELGKM